MKKQFARNEASENWRYQPELAVLDNTTHPIRNWRFFVNSTIAAEISSTSRYYDSLIQWERRETDSGLLYSLIDCARKRQEKSLDSLFEIINKQTSRDLILLNGNLNHDHDIEGTLSNIKKTLSRYSRIALVIYNPYLRPLYVLANRLKLRYGPTPQTFVTYADLTNLAKLAGLEIVRIRPTTYCPFKLLGIGNLINKILPTIPVVRHLCLATVVYLRPQGAEIPRKPSLSIVIPARNERGNIQPALERLKSFNESDIEIIFVEGHSSDNTWQEIERVVELYKNQFQLKHFKQTGKGKADAVRLGFSHATKELLTILDADLTMPPELLHRFYDAYCQGLGDFINGSRLLYPMEGSAMRPLNLIGNIFFAKALSVVLGNRISDSLCGTKLFSREDYKRFQQWRNDFGDFDPFGDYELLFPASEIACGIVDIPIRYRDRTYGSTNISRFRHGLMLLKMTLIGFFRIKLGKTRSY